MDGSVGWVINKGWRLTPLTQFPTVDPYLLEAPSGFGTIVRIDRGIPPNLYALILHDMIRDEQEKHETIMAAKAMFGGPDVQPEPDGA